MRPMKTSHPGRVARGGFTLIELAVVLAIVAVLAATAWPSYQSYVVRTQRAAAATCLTDMAGFMERVYATNLRYDQNNGVATALPAAQCITDVAARYTVALDGASLAAASFRVTATPLGAQATADAACGTLSLNQAGTKAVTGSAGLGACWR